MAKSSIGRLAGPHAFLRVIDESQAGDARARAGDTQVAGYSRVSRRLACAVAPLLLVAACASTPQAVPQQDALAKEFLTHPNAATIYVFRSPFNHYDADSVLYIDGRLIGATLPGAYFRLDASPGRHVLHGTGIDMGQIALETRPGAVYFVSLDVHGGHSNFRQVADPAGREQVRACCALLENWAPGQRPFILR